MLSGSKDMSTPEMVVLSCGVKTEPPFFAVPGDVFMVPFGSYLRVLLPPSSYCGSNRPLLETNFPIKSGIFKRGSFERLEFIESSASDFFVDILVNIPGTFEVHIIAGKNLENIEKFNFVVNPQLVIHSEDGGKEILPLEGLCLQTHITRCLGPLSDWYKHIELTAASGYNMVHFSPVQPLGISNSAYCVYDHQDIMHSIFVDGNGLSKEITPGLRLKKLRESVEVFEKKLGVLSLVDVLWNHIAINAPLLKKHPDIGFHLNNTPTLRPAFAIDQVIAAFSCAFGVFTKQNQASKLVDEEDFGDAPHSFTRLVKAIYPLFKEYLKSTAPTIEFENPPRNEEQVLALCSILRSAMDLVNVHEFFQCDVAEEAERFCEALSEKTNCRCEKSSSSSIHAEERRVPHPMNPRSANPDSKPSRITLSMHRIGTSIPEMIDQLKQCLLFSGERFGASLDPSVIDLDVAEVSDEINRTEISMGLIALNHSIKQACDIWLDEATRNIAGTLRYERLAENGPLKSLPISRSRPICAPYFSRVRSDEGTFFACVHNGWVFGGTSSGLTGETFPHWSGGLALLTRRIIPWADNAKLNYGRNRGDNPVLWGEMEMYSTNMAKIFHAFRIDNCHATPRHVARHFLDAARRVRPHLLVCAELFTGSLEQDREYVAQLGINLLIREAIHADSSPQLVHFLYEFGGGNPIGSVRDCTLNAIPAPPSDALVDRPWLSRFARRPSSADIGSGPPRFIEALDMSIRPFSPLLVPTPRHLTPSKRSRSQESTAAEIAAAVGALTPPKISSPRMFPQEADNEEESSQYPSERPLMKVSQLKPLNFPLALFFDVTHDNPSFAQSRTAEQTLTMASVLAFCGCAVGSTRGNDELFEEPISVVESKKYPMYTSSTKELPGIIPARNVLGRLHKRLGQEGFDEFFVSHEDVLPISFKDAAPEKQQQKQKETNKKKSGGKSKSKTDVERDDSEDLSSQVDRNSVLTLLRRNPETCETLVCISLPAFRGLGKDAVYGYRVELDGEIGEILLSARLRMEEEHESERERKVRHIEQRKLVMAQALGMLPSPKGNSHAEAVTAHDVSWLLHSSSFASKKKHHFDEQKEEQEEKEEEGMKGLPSLLSWSESNILQRHRIDHFVDSNTNTAKCSLSIDLVPGDVVILSTRITNDQKSALRSISDDLLAPERLRLSVGQIGLREVNALLWRDRGEELSIASSPPYTIPGKREDGAGEIFWAGVGGFAGLILNEVVLHDNLGHALCSNLRQGNWCMDWMVQRLDEYGAHSFKNVKPFVDWLRSAFDSIKVLPRPLVPKYFICAVLHLFKTILDIIVDVCEVSGDVCIHEGLETDPLLMYLLLASSQFYGSVPSAPLLKKEKMNKIQRVVEAEIIRLQSLLEKESKIPSMDKEIIENSIAQHKSALLSFCSPTSISFSDSLAAGHPHFSSGFMRCWGRDTFLALPGLLLVPRWWPDAANLICGFAASIRNGLIPNLLASGEGSRYNCRDAVWLWLRAVILYIDKSPESFGFLSRVVPRLHPAATQEGDCGIWKISDAIHEILSKHATGFAYREDNAGRSIDEHMKDDGFDVSVFMDSDNGFVFGGNSSNCGTWMDKMGESIQAGNDGIPATPRDGCAIEIAGIQCFVLNWVSHVVETRPTLFPHRGVVSRDDGKVLSYRNWYDRLKNSFERCFWIPQDPKEDSLYEIDSSMVKKRGFYKDTFRSSNTPSCNDFQLRPNQCIALSTIPHEMLNFDHASFALDLVGKTLVGPLGMKTLDPDDENYSPDYNMEDSDDYRTAKGFSYHNGPEWLWLTGFYAQALAHLATMEKPSAKPMIETRLIVRKLLSPHRDAISQSNILSLPELTNSSGNSCFYSCPAQAWTIGTLLEVLGKLYQSEMRK